MKYLLLGVLCAWLGYEIYVLVKTIIQKRNAKKLAEEIVENMKEDN